MSDIRKWFMKQHGPENGKDLGQSDTPKAVEEHVPPKERSENQVQKGHRDSGRRKTSKYFATEKKKPEDENIMEKETVKRVNKQITNDVKPSPAKKFRKDTGGSTDEDYTIPDCEMNIVDYSARKKPKSASKGTMNEDDYKEDTDTPSKSIVRSTGRGRGGRSGSGPASSASGRGGGRGSGRGGFMNFGERNDPPHKGEKEIPSGDPCCFAGLTFVISGTLDSLERGEAEDLIKCHGGRITGSISKKTNYLLCDDDIGGRKSIKAKELGTTFLTEDGLFDMIRSSRAPQSIEMTTKPSTKDSKTIIDGDVSSSPKKAHQRGKVNDVFGGQVHTSAAKVIDATDRKPCSSPPSKKTSKPTSLTWTEKYKPKIPNDIIGNQSLVKQLHDWLACWNENFINSDKKVRGKRQDDASTKKAILLSGPPGIGKTTSAKLVSQMLGFQTIEVNASDSRGKSGSKIQKGIEGRSANSVKELINNEAFSVNENRSKNLKTVLIMDEVDGMSSGDRGGVADLIDSIKLSKIPIVCICNDRYSQKLKSLLNHCLLLNFRKPTKQQMAKRLLQIATSEGLESNEISLEGLADRVNGDMRMALNQLQYMSFSMQVIKYEDVKKNFMSSAKDEDITPFNAVDKLFGFNGGKLRMDERIDLSMSDPDLVPLIIQENYMNYRPNLAGKDDNGLKRMGLIARAAESIGDGDIINVSIRRYRLWQLSQSGSFSSTILPAALLHGQREILEQGERNFNRFGGWLGKNSTMGKNLRLLEDVHGHFLASREYNGGRMALRTDYLSLLLMRLTDPLRKLSKEEAVQNVIEFMNCYSISQEDYEAIMLLSKFQGKPSPLDGVLPTVKTTLTKAYNQGFKTRIIRSADMISLPGMKKGSKSRAPVKNEDAEDDVGSENELAESGNDSSETEELGNGKGKLALDVESMSSKGIQVQVDLKSPPVKKASGGRGKKGGSESTEKKTTKSSSKRKK